ncbi:ArsR/SmtB family transcription factor [Saccharopolyspora tripterygii]
MTLRLVFNRDDLARVRLAESPDPMWELVLSSHLAREQRVPQHYLPWLRRARQRAGSSEQAQDWLRTLFTLVPPQGGFPDFLTPAPTTTHHEEGCERIACTARSRLRADLGAVFADRDVPSWVRSLADGDRDALHSVVGAVRGAHDALIAPQWHQIRRTVATDRESRLDALARGGVHELLAGTPTVTGWNGTVLETAYPSTRTVDLAGRGLTLVPSYFCVGTPVTWIDPELPPVLIYPAAPVPEPGEPSSPSPRLVALLGRTRAECLVALSSPRTTSDLAASLGCSVGTASKQAAVLRESGLISSDRRGGAVLHSLTRLGAALLTADRTGTEL